MRSLNPRLLSRLIAFVEEADDQEGGERGALISELDRLQAIKRSVKLARKRKVAKKETRRERYREVVRQCTRRAAGKCECGCGRGSEGGLLPLDPDHFEGGSNRTASETVEGIWMLARPCHEAKGLNQPSAEAWLRKRSAHCKKYDYPIARLEARLARLGAGL